MFQAGRNYENNTLLDYLKRLADVDKSTEPSSIRLLMISLIPLMISETKDRV